MSITITFDQGQLAAMKKKLSPQVYKRAVAMSLLDAADQAGRIVIEYTPAPGYLEPAGGRTWKRTGNARRSISPGLPGRELAENRSTAQQEIDPHVRVIQDRSIAMYVRPWLEEGKRDGKNGPVFMRVVAGGYRMFEKARNQLPEVVSRILANTFLRALSEDWRG